MGYRLYRFLCRFTASHLAGYIIMLNIMNKYLICIALLLGSFSAIATHEQIVEINLSGLTCSFCVYGLKKNLEKHAEVEKAEISLKQNKARIHLSPEADITIEELKEIIQDAGFASGDSQHFGRAEHPCEFVAC